MASKALRTEVRRREAEARRGTVFPLHAFVPARGVEAFERCRTLAGRKAGRPLQDGEALEAVCEDSLERHDPERKALRARARGALARAEAEATAYLKDGFRTRFTPAAEKHRLVLRQGDRCAVEGCGNGFLEDAHRVPHRAGGPNGSRNRDRLCTSHHGLVDRGLMKPAGLTGKEVRVAREGTVVGRLRRAPPAA